MFSTLVSKLFQFISRIQLVEKTELENYFKHNRGRENMIFFPIYLRKASISFPRLNTQVCQENKVMHKTLLKLC